MPDKDVTELVSFGIDDDECLEIRKCACGAEYTPWDFVISIYRDNAHRCRRCKKGFYFRSKITVYEVT